MGFFDFLLGSNETTSVPKDLTPEEYEALRPTVSGFLQQYLTSGGPTPTGDLAAPLTSETQSLIGPTVQGAFTLTPEMEASLAEITKTLSGSYLPGGSAENPFLDAMVQAAQGDLTRQWEGSIVPQLFSRFTSAGQEVQGQGSSAFAHEAGLASNDFLRALSDISTRLRGGAFEAERGRMAAAPQAASQLSADRLARLQAGFEASVLPQLVADLGLQRGLEVFNQQRDALLEVLQIAAGISQPTIANTQTSQGSPGLLSFF